MAKLQSARDSINEGRTTIGIELGSTRIKTVLIGEDNMPIASGSYDWENSYVNNIWTYSLEDVWKGVQEATGQWPTASWPGMDGRAEGESNRYQRHDARLYGL